MAADIAKLVSEAWKRAAELQPHERDEFVARLRERDMRVATEVERLLRQGPGGPSQDAGDGPDASGGPSLTNVPTMRYDDEETPDLGDLEPAKPMVQVPPMSLSNVDAESWPERIGPYHIEGEIAAGGAGVVLRARDDRFNRTLAVKLLRRRYLGNTEGIQRFQEEAQITGQLQHPGIPPVYDVGALDDGRPFLTMKLIKGRTFSDWLREKTDDDDKLPRLLAAFEQICQTMAYAHSRNIIHRDLKPGNVMVGAFGEVQVMDWGLAKLLGAAPNGTAVSPQEKTIFHTTRDSDSSWETRHGLAMGTPAFMSPEQARGEVDELDKRTDVFSLGAILCTILTGRPPYPGDRPTEVLAMAQRGDLSIAYGRLEDCGADAELVELAKRCLSPERDGRPRDAGEVAEHVADYLAQVQQRLKQAEIDRARRDVQIREERKRRRVQLGLALSFAAMLVVGTLAWTWIDRLHAAEAARLESQFSRALSRAETIRDQAAAVSLVSRDDWERADELWRQAVTVADDINATLLKGTDRPELAARLEALRNELKPQADAVHKDREMYERLDRAFEMRGDIRDSDYRAARSAVVIFGHSGAKEYAAAFRDYGIDVLKLSPADAARKLKNSAIAPRLAEALTDWIVLWYQRPEAKRLLQIVESIDADRQRSAVRTALIGGNRKRLVNLARKIDAEKSPPTTILPLADALHLVGEIDQAIDLLERARAHRPEEFWYNDVLAVLIVAAHPERVEDAVAYLQAAAALRPRLHVPFGNLGVAYAILGRFTEAESYFHKAIGLKPDNIFNRVALANNVYLSQQRAQEAQRVIDACLARDPRCEQAWLCQAFVHAQAGRLDDALKAVDRALAGDPDSVWTLYQKAMLLLRRSEIDKAAVIGDKLLKQYPHLNAGYEVMALVAVRRGRRDESISILKRGLQKSVVPGDLRVMLASAMGDGIPATLENYPRIQTALGQARVAAYERPDNRVVVLQVGQLMEQYRLVFDAQTLYWSYLRRHPGDVEIRDRLKQLLIRTGYAPQAEIVLAGAIAKLPATEQAKWHAVFLEARKARPVVARKPRRRFTKSAVGK